MKCPNPKCDTELTELQAWPTTATTVDQRKFSVIAVCCPECGAVLGTIPKPTREPFRLVPKRKIVK